MPPSTEVRISLPPERHGQNYFYAVTNTRTQSSGCITDRMNCLGELATNRDALTDRQMNEIANN